MANELHMKSMEEPQSSIEIENAPDNQTDQETPNKPSERD